MTLATSRTSDKMSPNREADQTPCLVSDDRPCGNVHLLNEHCVLLPRPTAGRRGRRPLQIHCNVYCRGRRLDVPNLSAKSYPTAKHINPLRRGVINVAPYNDNATFIVGDDACDIPIFSAISNWQAEQISCRGRRLDDPRFPTNTKPCNKYSDSLPHQVNYEKTKQ